MPRKRLSSRKRPSSRARRRPSRTPPLQTPLALFWSICAPARVRPRPRSRAALPAAESLPAAPLVLSVPAVPATIAKRLADITPLPPRRSEELKSAANVSPIPGISALRLGEASFENTPLPPRRSEEFASDPAPAADNAPPAPSVVHAENAPENLPAPPRRPDELSANQIRRRPFASRRARPRGRGATARTVVAAAPPADNRGFLEKLFGGAPQPQTSSPALGYAPAEGGVTTAARSVMSMSSPTARYDQFTAVYDISAHTVYLPNGQRLEAHSGLGSMLDDPRSVELRKCAAPRRRPSTR